MRFNRTKGLPISPFSFLHTFRTQLFGRPAEILLLHHHHAVVLLLESLFLNLSILLAGSKRGRRHRAARVLNTEVPLFGTRSSVIWITASTTPSSTFIGTLPLAIYKGM